MERVDKERFERVVKTPEMFERYLPYAMALGVEKKWARAFKDIYIEPPTWYAGSNMHAFNASSFSGRLSPCRRARGSATMLLTALVGRLGLQRRLVGRRRGRWRGRRVSSVSPPGLEWDSPTAPAGQRNSDADASPSRPDVAYGEPHSSPG